MREGPKSFSIKSIIKLIRLPLKDLAKMLCIAAPSMTRLIEKLVHKDLVKVVYKGHTKRVYITDKGREIIPIIGEVFHKTPLDFMKLSQPCDFNNLIDQINHLTNQLK